MMGAYINLPPENVIACKRCGRQPKVMAGSVEGKFEYCVICERCDITLGWSHTKESAILEWNDWQKKISSIKNTGRRLAAQKRGK